MFIFGLTEKEGWYFTENFRVYQKVNQNVYCYVSKYIGFYIVQLYERGTTGFCTLEARSKNDVEALFVLAEKWLKEYKEWNIEKIGNDPFHISRKNHRELCWI